jgi:hypothetical protein
MRCSDRTSEGVLGRIQDSRGERIEQRGGADTTSFIDVEKRWLVLYTPCPIQQPQQAAKPRGASRSTEIIHLVLKTTLKFKNLYTQKNIKLRIRYNKLDFYAYKIIIIF